MDFTSSALSLTGCFIEALSADNFIIHDISTSTIQKDHINFRNNTAETYTFGIVLVISDGKEQYTVAIDLAPSGAVWLNIKNRGRTNQKLNDGIRNWWTENLRSMSKRILTAGR